MIQHLAGNKAWILWPKENETPIALEFYKSGLEISQSGHNIYVPFDAINELFKAIKKGRELGEAEYKRQDENVEIIRKYAALKKEKEVA